MRAVVLSWTLVHRAPAGVETPFVLALVRTAQGNRLARAASPVEIGDEVELGGEDDSLVARRVTR